MLRKIRFRIAFAALSGTLLVLSFPNFNFSFLAWIGLVPLFFAIKDSRPKEAFLLSYLAGVIFFLGTIYWLIHVTLPGMIAVVVYLALYFGLFGLLFRSAIRYPLSAIFLIPAAWVGPEWLRSSGWSGFSWALLGHSQAENLPAIQIADILGAYGVSFLVVTVNAAAFLAIRGSMDRKRAATPVVVAVFLVFLSIAYGHFRLKNVFTGETAKVSVIQGNIPQSEKWDAKYRGAILAKYEALTQVAAKEGPDLIIWPETSVPVFLETDEDVMERIKFLVRSVNTPLLVGAPREDKKTPDGYYNSAILFSEEGRVAASYDKIHLVPFGEYIPFKRVFFFVQNFSKTAIGDFSKGASYKVFDFFVRRKANTPNIEWKLIKKVKFSCMICFEDIFPYIARKFVKSGAVFLINMTNDAWFLDSSAPFQHVQSSVFRAVENRVNVVRAANTGVSCFIDQKGRVHSAVSANGKAIFVDGFSSGDLVLTKTKTLYNTYGDLFSYLCIAAIIFSVFGAGDKRGKI